MLNKRLLIASAKKKEQRKVKLNIGFFPESTLGDIPNLGLVH